MTKKDNSALDQAEIYWGKGLPDAKLSPEAWSYFYADILIDIAKHAESSYPDDLVFRRLLKEISNK
jgi:hypothetical protein